MPRFEKTLIFARHVAEVFDFFARPTNLLRLSPPELHMQLVAGPDRLQLGSRITWKGRRWGIPHRIVSEVTAFDADVSFVDEQRQGPFSKWVHTHHFEGVSGGTLAHELIEFEPPSGLLGLVVTVTVIEKDLEWIFTHREEKLRDLLGPGVAESF